MKVFLLPDKEYTQQCSRDWRPRVLHTGDTLRSTVFQLEVLMFISQVGFPISNRDYFCES